MNLPASNTEAVQGGFDTDGWCPWDWPLRDQHSPPQDEIVAPSRLTRLIDHGLRLHLVDREPYDYEQEGI